MQDLRRLWQQRDYRYLWIGQSLSMVGDHMIWVATALYVTELTGSTRDVGVVLAAGAGALVVFLLIGGVTADRLPRQKIMIASDLARAAAQTVIAVLIFTGPPDLLTLTILIGLFGAAEAFFRPAMTGLIPQTVPEDLIQQAQAVTATSMNVSAFLGPGIATIVALQVGFAWVYLADAVTFVVSAVLLTRIRARPRGDTHNTQAGKGVLGEMVAGYREVRRRAWVWVILLIALVGVFASIGPFQALGATIARDVHHQIAVFGWWQVASGVGAIIGSVLSIRWRPLYPLRTGSMFLVLWPAAMLLYAIGAPLWLTLLGGALNGLGFSLFLVWWETALAERIPPHSLSRVSSYDWMVSLAFLPVGYLLAGFLGEHIAPQHVLLGGATVALAVVPLALASREVRTLRRLES